MKKKKDRAVVFTVSNNLTFSIACVMMDIKRLSPSLADEYVVFHDGIKKADMKLLNSILPTRFIEYNLPFEDVSFIPPKILNYFTKMVFSKFECLKLLNEYKNILFLDYDIVIQNDISELFEFTESGIRMMPGNIKVREQLLYENNQYNMDCEGICACIFVFQDHIGDFNNMYEFCYRSLKKFASSLYLPEQAIFDFMIQKFNLNINPISSKMYSPHPTDKDLSKDVKILHAYGQPKFWNGLQNHQWESNYRFWLKIGGSGYYESTLFLRLLNKFHKYFKFILKKFK
jgi:lipopolysaccharide biosynthesis glycosyltransferase